MKYLSTFGCLLLKIAFAEDKFKSMSEVCLENNFISEQYTVTTEDDYILELYRIPGQIEEQPGD